MKHFVSDKISAQVSSFPQGQEWNGSELAFSQLTGIPSVAPQLVNYFLALSAYLHYLLNEWVVNIAYIFFE